MIKAEHNIAAQFIFYKYIFYLMKKHFSHFYLVNEPPKINNETSLVITPNHISWWDGFFIGHLEKTFYNRKAHIMMLEEQLSKYWFFSKVGAFSIKQESIKSILETRSYAREVISNSSNCVILFPQGEIEDYEKRPLTLKRGIRNILTDIKSNVTVLPVAFKIQYYNEMKPSIIACFGEPIAQNELNKDFMIFENEFYRNLEVLSEAAAQKNFSLDLFKGNIH